MATKMGYTLRVGIGSYYFCCFVGTEARFTSDRNCAHVFDTLAEAQQERAAFEKEQLYLHPEPKQVVELPEDLKYFGNRLAEQPGFFSSAVERFRTRKQSGNYSGERTRD